MASSYIDTAIMNYALFDDELIDRGNCESTTPPMLSGETTPITNEATWARSSDFARSGATSYKYTKGAGASSRVDFNDNASHTDMHGLVAGETIETEIWVYIPTASGLLGSEISFSIFTSDGAFSQLVSAAPVETMDVWQRVEISGTIPLDATGAIIRIAVSDAAANAEYFYVDDVSGTSRSVLAGIISTRMYHIQAPNNAKSPYGVMSIIDPDNVAEKFDDPLYGAPLVQLMFASSKNKTPCDAFLAAHAALDRFRHFQGSMDGVQVDHISDLRGPREIILTGEKDQLACIVEFVPHYVEP